MIIFHQYNPASQALILYQIWMQGAVLQLLRFCNIQVPREAS